MTTRGVRPISLGTVCVAGVAYCPDAEFDDPRLTGRSASGGVYIVCIGLGPRGTLIPMTTPFRVKPTLTGKLVTLRPIQAEDADLLDRIIRDDDEIARLTGSVHRSDEDPREDLPIERLREIYGGWATAEDRLVLAVVDNASGDLVGEVVLNEWDEGNRSCGFRTLIGAAGRGRGLGTETARLTVEHGLRTMGLHRISLEVYAFNPRARHVYEKVGFVHEGTGRDALLFDDVWIDVHYMAVTDN